MRLRLTAMVLAMSALIGVAGIWLPAVADRTSGAASSTQGLDAHARQSAVAEAAKLLTEQYVFPDVGRRAAAVIADRQAAGDYDAITDPDAFARRLTDDLQEVTHDKHLRVRSNVPRHDPQKPRETPPRSEAGFTRVDVLHGNIGYVSLDGFVPKDLFKPEAEKAMRLLMFVPMGRAENPITHANWEGRGVDPDVGTASADAFAKAYAVALESAGSHPPPADSPSSPDAVVEQRLLAPRSTAQPGSEAALRRSIAELQAGAPRYELLGPSMAALTREQLPQIHADIAALGALQSVAFVEVGRMGETVYDVKFANGERLWSIALDDEGKIIMAGFHPK